MNASRETRFPESGGGRAAAADAAALEARDLVVGHAGRPVATIPALRLRPGDSLRLTGSSGAGKTTVLMTLAGLAAPLSGAVILEGERLDSLPPRRRDRIRGRRIGLVFQDIHGLAGLTVLDNVLMAAFATGARQDADQARRLLERVGLAALADRRFETLSRGEAQRAAIARALLLDPVVILADEPTASLDDENAAAVAGLLVEASRLAGAALVVATHDARLTGTISRSLNLGDPQ